MSGIQPLSTPSQIFAWCGMHFAGTGVEMLFALDRQLGQIVRTTEQPIIGQMRLTWWFEALAKLDTGDVPAQPLLRAAAEYVVAGTITGRALAAMTEGWEVLLDQERSDAASLTQFAHLRGGTLFRAIAALLGTTDDRVDAAGALWALSDLAANVSVEHVRVQARRSALDLSHAVFASRWRDARPLGALSLDAHMAMTGLGVADGPRRAARIALFRMIGR